MQGKFITLAVLLSVFLAAPLAMAKMYKWTDEQGNVHYSDKIPPKAIKKPHDSLSKEGITIDRQGAAKTPEEIAQEASLKRMQEATKKALAIQQTKDKALLNTFKTEDDIILSRDGKLSTYDAQIRITYENIERLKARLVIMQNRAAVQERQGHNISEKTTESIENNRAEIRNSYASILRQENDKKKITKKYSVDLERFRKLKELEHSNMAKASEDTGKYASVLVETAIECKSDAHCDRLWRLARNFALKHATTPVYADSEKIFITQIPVEEDQIGMTVSRLRTKKKENEVIFMDVQCKKEVLSQTWCGTEKAERLRKLFRSIMLRDTTNDLQ